MDSKTQNNILEKNIYTSVSTQVANEMSRFVRDKLKEQSFTRKILPPMFVGDWMLEDMPCKKKYKIWI